jgi:hypothetical protein
MARSLLPIKPSPSWDRIKIIDSDGAHIFAEGDPSKNPKGHATRSLLIAGQTLIHSIAAIPDHCP